MGSTAFIISSVAVVAILGSLAVFIYAIASAPNARVAEEPAAPTPQRRLRRRGFQVIPGPLAVQPVPDSGPGLYRVTGVIAATGNDAVFDIEAMTLQNAKVKAELKGLIVTDAIKAM